MFRLQSPLVVAILTHVPWDLEELIRGTLGPGWKPERSHESFRRHRGSGSNQKVARSLTSFSVPSLTGSKRSYDSCEWYHLGPCMTEKLRTHNQSSSVFVEETLGNGRSNLPFTFPYPRPSGVHPTPPKTSGRRLRTSPPPNQSSRDTGGPETSPLYARPRRCPPSRGTRPLRVSTLVFRGPP